MKKSLKGVKVDGEIFKRIKKNKSVIYVSQVNETLEKLQEKEKIVLQLEGSNKKIVRKIKTKYQVQNYEELKDTLGKKSENLYPKSTQKENLIAIELKTKPKIISKIFLIILTFLIIAFSYFFLSNTLMKYNNNKLKKEIGKVNSEITYAIIEINPKIILELKNGKVINTGCLNDDCLLVFNDIDLNDLSLKEATEKLYNKAKDENIDVSNGVSVSSSNEKVENEVDELEYVKYKKIDRTEEKEEIKKVIDNDDIKEEKNENKISNDILSAYKKDKDYGNLYKCEIADSSPVCYITESFAKKLSSKNESIEEFMNALKQMRNLENILDKFEFDYEQGGVEGLKQMIVNRVVVNGTSYPLFSGITYVETTITSNPNDIPNEEKHSEYYEFGLTIYDSAWEEEPTSDFKIVFLPIEKIELVSKTYNEQDLLILTVENGYINITKNS